MKMRSFLLVVSGVLAAAALSAVECFSEKGIAANFVDIKGKWKCSESTVTVSPLPEGLRFTFHTGVKTGDFLFNRAKHDSPAVVGKESIELQICPDPSTGVYYHIGVNPAGTLYTARKKDTSWEPGQLKADVKDWSRVTIDVTFADLGQKNRLREVHGRSTSATPVPKGTTPNTSAGAAQGTSIITKSTVLCASVHPTRRWSFFLNNLPLQSRQLSSMEKDVFLN